MRICMISSTPFPPAEGIGYYTWNLARFLVADGHQVHLVTRGSHQLTEPTYQEGITIWRPRFFPIYPFHVHLHGLFLRPLLQQLEKEVDVFHFHTPLVPWVATNRPTLATVHTPMRADAASVTADTLLGKLIKLQAPVSYRLEQTLLDNTDAIAAVANSVAQELGEYGVDPEDVHVTGVGVDTDLFRPAPVAAAFPGGERVPYALSVARLAPRKGLAELKRLLDEDDVDEVEIGFEGNSGLARKGGVTLVMRLIEGEFPNYQQVIPDDVTVRLVLPTDQLVHALRRVVLLSSERSRAVKLELGEGQLQVSSNNPDLGDASDELDIEYSGDAIAVGFNARYLLDALGALHAKEVRLGLQNDLSPAQVVPTNDDDTLAVVMPMRL